MHEQYVKNHLGTSSKPFDQTSKCDCRKKVKSPMEGNYQVNNVVYKYDVTRGRMGVLFQ